MTNVLPNVSLQQQPVPFQFFIARNCTVGAPRCEIGKVGHHYGRAIKGLDEDDGFFGVREKYSVNAVLGTISLAMLYEPGDKFWSRQHAQ
jgi:hypothetical protein